MLVSGRVHQTTRKFLSRPNFRHLVGAFGLEIPTIRTSGEVLRACGNAAEKICFCNVNQNGDMAIISYYIDIIDKICIFFRLMGVTAVLGGGFKPVCFHPEPWGNDPIWRAYSSNGLFQPPTTSWLMDVTAVLFPSKIKWDLTNGPLSKLLELVDTPV